MPRATMRDVADHAGVSHQTVSNVLNGHPSIRPEMRARVLSAINALNYQPNQNAQALRQARITTLCCTFFGHNAEDIHDPYRNLIQSAFVAEANASRYSMTTAFLDEGQPESLARFQKRYLQGQFGGTVIVGTTLPADDLTAIRALGVHTVLFDHQIEGHDAPTVQADYAGGMAAMVRHHAAQGRTHLALLIPAGDPGSSAQARLHGFQNEARRLNLDTQVMPCTWSFESGRDAMHALWTSGARPDAVLAASDRIAAGALRAAHTLGLQVPSEVAISGFDDFDFARFTTPTLTTLQVPHGEMARQAVRHLVALVEQRPLPPTPTYPVPLLVRESA
ncbi:LacI family DNA-binding transcriptional regulator [Deinococcus radiotolerans]|uniref:LacI family transcriptional regulator n=1 Tax=Deinococcus radiotolerans TaxID=1309407 RepID=A0ABQ2FQR0_9DEIO|nr:LacI family DNA-binding transcriptional regulator [Deinococcus radiotolerans]GGL17705.1 LacI family transcriptional regulator [Deinococcus radiotolerans]